MRQNAKLLAWKRKEGTRSQGMQGMQLQKLERGKKQIHALEPLEGALVPLISAQRLCSQTPGLQNCKRMNVCCFKPTNL